MKLISEKKYHKNYRKYSKDSRWRKFVFNNNYHKTGYSSFAFIIKCLINNEEIPFYFYPHPLSGVSKQEKKLIARKTGLDYRHVKLIELHFNGRSSDMLLEYSKYKDVVDIMNIGTHKDIFG